MILYVLVVRIGVLARGGCALLLGRFVALVNLALEGKNGRSRGSNADAGNGGTVAT